MARDVRAVAGQSITAMMMIAAPIATNRKEQDLLAAGAEHGGQAISVTGTPAARARRTMSAVPRPPGKAMTISGRPSSSIC
jgi:hypothetical protein